MSGDSASRLPASQPKLDTAVGFVMLGAPMNGVGKSSLRTAVGIGLLTLAVYGPSLGGGFVWDDTTLLVENRLIRAADGLRRIWFTTEAQDYYPITNTLGWFEWRWWGMQPLGYRLVNLLLHIGNALLVWRLLERLQLPHAWFCGLVFAIHPVNVATAAWIIEQKNTLSMCFALLAARAYLNFDQSGRAGWYGLSWGLFVLALLSKTAVVMLPAALLGCVWWQRGHLRIQDWRRMAPFFAASLAAGLVTLQFQAQYRIGQGLPEASVGWASRLAVAGSAPWFYLSKAVWPVGLTVIYPGWQMEDRHWVSYALGVAMAGGFVLFWTRRAGWGRPLLFGFGCFVGMLFPVLGFFDQTFHRYASVADHWQYYAIVAPIALVVAGAERLRQRIGWRARRGWRAAATGAVALLAAGAWARAHVYVSDMALWRDNVSKNPGAYVAHHNLGFALAQAGRLDEAVAEFRETVRLRPDFARAYFNLGSALARMGRVQEAIAPLEEAVRLRPDDFEAHNNLANALAQLNRLDEAIEHFETALRLRPDQAGVHFNLGLALEQARRFPDAMRQYESALKLDPAMHEARESLARLRAAGQSQQGP